MIPAPQRNGKYCVYSKQHILLIQMIRQAQSLGFNLIELKDLVQIKAQTGEFPLALTNQLLDTKHQAIQAQLNALHTTEKRLLALKQDLNTMVAQKAQLDSAL
ncbi:MAG: MerR family DNA-binding protein [Thiolinea sp.]